MTNASNSGDASTATGPSGATAETPSIRVCFNCDTPDDLSKGELRTVGKKASPLEPVRNAEIFLCSVCMKPKVKREPSESVWRISEDFEGNTLVDEMPEGWYVVNFAAETYGGVWCGPYRSRSEAQDSIFYLGSAVDERLLYLATKTPIDQ